MSDNTLKIDGNQNIVLQGVDNSTINIQAKLQYPKALTHAIPLLSESAIVGRQKDLEDLKNMLFDQRQVVLMNGLGGIGKTTLAQVYAHKYWDNYQHVAWITQLSDHILQDFTTSYTLSKNLDVSPELNQTQDIFAEIMRKLASFEKGPNLLVLDNADESIEQIRHALPKQPIWHILITSRQALNGFHIKHLDFLSPEDALLLFKSHYTRTDLADVQIEKLIKSVDYHTLAIEILSKTAMVQRYDFETLYYAVQTDVRANVKINRLDTDKVERITSFLVSIFGLSKLNDDELWLLKQFVCMPPEFHDYTLLKELINPEKSNREAAFSETLEALAQKGWLLKDSKVDGFKMHRIIGEVVSKQACVSTQEISELVKSITCKMKIDETLDNPMEKFFWQPFGEAILEVLYRSQDIEKLEIMELQDKLAKIYKEMGHYQKAKQLRSSALQTSLKFYGEDHKITTELQSNLALVFQAIGDYEDAKMLLEKALAWNEKNFGTKHPLTAASYSNLALILQTLGDYEAAKALLEKAIKSGEQNFGMEHPITAVYYSNLAGVLQCLGDYEAARILLEKALESAEQNFGAEHLIRAKRYSNLAVVLKDIKDYNLAETYFTKSLNIYEKLFGEEHPYIAVLNSNLAMLYRDLKNYERAKALIEKAIESDEKNFGVEHPTTAARYNNLAWLYMEIRQPEKAIFLWEKAYPTLLKYLGKGHPHTKSVAEALKKYKTPD